MGSGTLMRAAQNMPVLAAQVPPPAWADTNPRGALAIGLQQDPQRLQLRARARESWIPVQQKRPEAISCFPATHKLGPWTSRCAPFVCFPGERRRAFPDSDWASVCCCRTERASVLETIPGSSQSALADSHPGWRCRFRERAPFPSHRAN